MDVESGSCPQNRNRSRMNGSVDVDLLRRLGIPRIRESCDEVVEAVGRVDRRKEVVRRRRRTDVMSLIRIDQS